ncbi:hypothetical protein HXR13_002316 [Salmonella enterica]|nr:hypothetical protein [Salmonella enterica]EHH3790019.1 hypothetical protein [Salmonella enterica subsp. enterica serovar Stanleyville]
MTRLIPAGAGNTQLSDEIKTELTGLSPLARGTLPVTTEASLSLSPLARGTHR